MTVQEQNINYAKMYFNDAFEAYAKYGIHPIATLTQGALESAYDTSVNALSANNLYGIIAAGSTNDYWKGQSRTAGTGLKFRVYASKKDSTMDFARLISNKYLAAAMVSSDINAYAKAIAYSPYISEQNGDNRSNYESGLKTRGKYMQATVDELMKSVSQKKKF
jgi:flagellar protein FlgJ